VTITAPSHSPAPLSPDSVAGHRRVIVGMDENAVSVTALRFAATEAAYRGGDVLAMSVWHYPYTWGLPTSWPEDADPSAYMLTELQQTVDTVCADRVAAGEPAVTITAEVVQGDAAGMLSYAARGAALLVLGARHHNRLLGSVSQACTSHPPCAVVVVPTADEPA